MLTSSEGGVRALALTPRDDFGDLLARLQSEERDLGSLRSPQQVNIHSLPETAVNQ